MSAPTDPDARDRYLERLADDIRHLPWLAAQASTPDDTPDGGGGPRVTGSRIPAGVDLGGIDQGRGYHQPRVLALLEQAGRGVRDEIPALRYIDTEPRLGWEGHCNWLVGTMPFWGRDDWCVDWVTGKVSEALTALQGAVERHCGWRTCAACGGRVVAYATEELAVAECPACQRVLGLSTRRMTTREAADHLGVSPAAVRKRLERGHLTRGDDGKILVM